jgi:rod shape-determining protein MreC
MKNIVELIKRFYVFLIYLVLQGLALAMLFNNTNYHRAEFISNSTDWVGGIYSKRANLAQYIKLNDINDELALEIAELRSERPENFEVFRMDLDSTADSTLNQRYYYRMAKVVNATTNREKNYVTIDRGALGDVRPDMGVVANGGIVGVVRSVSDHYAMVMPILHTDFKASVKLKRVGYYGSLVWQGGNPGVADLIDIPITAPVNVGDSIVTTGFSTYYPAGLMVGVIEEIQQANTDTYLLKIRLSVDYRKLNYVMVIEDIRKNEIDSLTNQIEQLDAATGNR